MKIAYFVLKGMPLGGGIEKYTEEIGSRLVERGHEVIVYAMRHYGATAGAYRGMDIRLVPTLQSRSFEKIAAAFVAAFAQSWEKDVDVVHVHAFGPGAAAVIPRLQGRPVVVQGHGLEWKRSRWGFLGQTFLRLTEIPSVRVPNRVTVVSLVQQKYLRDTYGVEAEYIPTGVNSPELRPPDIIREMGLAGNDYILFAARHVREKGVHHLIRAYQQLDTSMQLVIAGDAQHEDAYTKELRELAGADPRIHFPGFVQGQLLEELFSNAYVFVLPSELEGLPIALLEAMSYGGCCVASDIAENLEAGNGLVHHFENQNPADLARVLQGLIDHPAKANEFGARARRHVVKNHSWDSIADRFEALYSSMIK